MKKIFTALLAASLLTACNSTDITSNNDIDTTLRSSFKPKNDSVTMAVRKNNSGAYYVLGSEDFYVSLKKKTETLRTIYWDPAIKSAPSVIDEFHVIQEGIKNHELTSEKNGYTLRFANTQKESYVSVLKIHANEQQHYLVAAVYSLIGKKWKIEKIVPMRYSFFGYNANDMYEMAKEKESKGFIVDAYVFAHGAFNLSLSGGQDLVLNNEKEIKSYQNRMLTKLQIKHGKFPLDIRELDPIPQLLGFDMAYHNKGLYTAVHYNTWTPMDDPSSLTQEYEKVKNHIEANFPDLDKKQPYIFYRAFSQVPGPNGNYDIYGFMDTNNKTRKTNR